MSNEQHSTTLERLESIERKRDALYRDLEKGYEAIEAALTSGADTREWERHWKKLLRDYERLCDRLQREG